MPLKTQVAIAIAGNVDSAKCFSKGTRVMRSDGSIILVENIKVGDKLMGDDSTERTVQETHNGTGQLYEITPTKGDSYVVNGEHILCLKYSQVDNIQYQEIRKDTVVKYMIMENGIPKSKAKPFATLPEGITKDEAKQRADNFHKTVQKLNHGDIIEISVRNFLTLPKWQQEQFKWYRAGVEFPQKELPLDPYMVGMWLGDGTSSTSAITTADNEIVEYFTRNLEKYGLKFQKMKVYAYQISQIGKIKRGGNHFLNTLRDLGMLNNKHIPDIYKINSRENRLKLLAGIIDSDGYYSKEKNYYAYRDVNQIQKTYR